MVTSSPIGEEKKPLPNSCCQNSNIVIQQPEKKVPLPFLGRSQSLLNIPLDLNRQLTVVEPKVAVVQQPVPATIIPQSSSRRSRTTPTTGGNTKRNCNKPRYQVDINHCLIALVSKRDTNRIVEMWLRIPCQCGQKASKPNQRLPSSINTTSVN